MVPVQFFLPYLRTKKETSIQKTGTASGNKYFPAPCSITKTEMPLDPTSTGIPADPFLPAPSYLNPQYLLYCPCSQAFGKRFAFQQPLFSKKDYKLLDINWEQALIEEKQFQSQTTLK